MRVLTRYSSRRTDLAIGLSYDTPLSEARQVLLEALAGVEGILPEPAVEVDLVGFGESSIDFMVRYWTLPQKLQVRRVQSQAIIRLKQVCDQAGFSIPFPIRTVYFPEQQHTNDKSPI